MAAAILVSCVNRRLNRFPAAEDQPTAIAGLEPEVPDCQSATPSTEAPQFAISRQASRIKVHATNDFLVDGVASVLVDISTLGAQVLSPATLRPNRVVRLMLRTGTGGFAGVGRIVWARLESSSTEAAVRYRAGVQFTNMDLNAINMLVAQQGRSQFATPSPS
jgi:hypothetical protein